MDAVILVSGWAGPGIEWRLSPIRGQLRDAGFKTHHFARQTLGFESIDINGSRLANFIEGLEADRVFLVGHSMGGLVSRVAQHHLETKPEAIVTLGTPHYGVRGADMAFFSTSAREMAAGSHFLTNLNEIEAQKNLLCVSGKSDRLVPKESALHKCSNRVFHAEGGHLTMLYNHKVAETIKKYLLSIPKT